MTIGGRSAAPALAPAVPAALRHAGALLVDAPAGLDAAPAQAALAAHIARPVAAAGHAVAERALDKAFQIESLRAGRAHGADLVDGKLPRQDDAVGAQFFGFPQGQRVRDIGERGKEESPREPRLPGKVKQPRVLDDQAVGPHPGGKPGNEPPGGAALPGFDQGVHGYIDAAASFVGQVGEARKLAGAEIFRLHACGKMLESHIERVGSGGQGGEERGGVPRGREDLRPGRRFGRGCAHAP